MEPLRLETAAVRSGSCRAPLLLAAALSISGCASTELVNAWKDPQGPPAPLENVLVIAVKKDEGRRRLMEDAFVSALEKRSVKATPSYQLFATSLPDTQQVIEVVRQNGFDGVIVASSLNPQVERNFVPGYTTTEPLTRFSHWAQAYRTYYVDVYHPGYVEVEHIVRHRVDVWSTRDKGRLLWTAEGRTVDPSSSAEVIKEITAVVVPELEKNGIIAKKK